MLKTLILGIIKAGLESGEIDADDLRSLVEPALHPEVLPDIVLPQADKPADKPHPGLTPGPDGKPLAAGTAAPAPAAPAAPELDEHGQPLS